MTNSFSAILLAEITISTEAAVAITALLSAVAGAAAWGVKGWIGSLTEERDSWKSIAKSNIVDLETVANRIRRTDGKPPIKVETDVVPESSSPATKKQKQTADIATIRAKQALLRKELNLPPQQEENERMIEDMTNSMKEGVDKAAYQIKEEVDDAAEEIKNKIDDIW